MGLLLTKPAELMLFLTGADTFQDHFQSEEVNPELNPYCEPFSRSCSERIASGTLLCYLRIAPKENSRLD
jgi:hypothetical protein